MGGFFHCWIFLRKFHLAWLNNLTIKKRAFHFFYFNLTKQLIQVIYHFFMIVLNGLHFHMQFVLDFKSCTNLYAVIILKRGTRLRLAQKSRHDWRAWGGAPVEMPLEVGKLLSKQVIFPLFSWLWCYHYSCLLLCLLILAACGKTFSLV